MLYCVDYPCCIVWIIHAVLCGLSMLYCVDYQYVVAKLEDVLYLVFECRLLLRMKNVID
jgi:hypothetical protein